MRMKHTSEFNQTRPWSTIQAPVQGRGAVRFHRYRSAASAAMLSGIDRIIIIQTLVLGSVMQAYANDALEAILVASFLLLIGMVIVRLAFPGRKPEMRAFLLTFSVSVFVGGLAQVYSQAVFNQVQSTIDAPKFFGLISPQPPFTTMDRVSYINAPLAVVIWQQVYKVTWWLGFKFGPYTGVMFNAFMMGLVGSLTVQIARELFDDDGWRLRRAGTLVAFCGLFLLFGSILIRDSFTTFFSTLALWGIVRWLVRPGPRTLLFAAMLTGVSAWVMEYLREEAVFLFGLYWFLALLLWVVRRFDAISLFVAAFLLYGVLAASSYLAVYFQNVQEIQISRLENYADLAYRSSSDDSLGLRLVVDQPLPIRLVLGSGALMINPIPLWNNFQIGLRDYHWIKGYHGIYQVVVMPLVFAGLLAVFRLFRKDRERALPLMFLAMYLLMNTASVVATSMEQRHIGQFFAALLVIASLPDTREKETHDDVKSIRVWWFAIVAFVHLAWAGMKFIT